MRKEINDTWLQAQANLRSAKTLFAGGHYDASAFYSQQAAELALKALYLQRRRRRIFTHDLSAIGRELSAPEEVIEAAAELTSEYVTARYPNAVGGVPAQVYTQRMAEVRLTLVRSILHWVEQCLPSP